MRCAHRARFALALGILVLLALLVAACGGQPASAPTQVAAAPTEAPKQAAPTQAPPTQAPTNTAVPPTATTAPATKAPTTAPTVTKAAPPTTAPTAAPVVADASNCVKCHTDEASLQKLAKEEAPAEALSEGEG